MTAGRIQPQQPPATFLQLASGRKPSGPPGDPAGQSTWQARPVWDLPGYRLHPLRGDLKGLWSIAISGNWRITCRFEAGDVYDVDLVDYH